MTELKSKHLMRPIPICFWEPSRCDGKIPTFSAQILQIKFIRTKWCENRANSMFITHPILYRLERGRNARILPNTYRCNQTKFIERISVELHFYGSMNIKASYSTYINMFLRAVEMWWKNTHIFGPNIANQIHTYKMMWKPRYLDAFHTSNIEPFGTRFKRSNTPNTFCWKQRRFTQRISVELHFNGKTKVKDSNST
jgi:hypothetical protein